MYPLLKYTLLTSVHWKSPEAGSSLVAMAAPTIHTVIAQHFPLKQTRAPWRNGWFQIDHRLPSFPYPWHGRSVHIPTVGLCLRTQPWQSKVLWRPSGQYTWLNPIKASVNFKVLGGGYGELLSCGAQDTPPKWVPLLSHPPPASLERLPLSWVSPCSEWAGPVSNLLQELGRLTANELCASSWDGAHDKPISSTHSWTRGPAQPVPVALSPCLG